MLAARTHLAKLIFTSKYVFYYSSIFHLFDCRIRAICVYVVGSTRDSRLIRTISRSRCLSSSRSIDFFAKLMCTMHWLWTRYTQYRGRPEFNICRLRLMSISLANEYIRSLSQYIRSAHKSRNLAINRESCVYAYNIAFDWQTWTPNIILNVARDCITSCLALLNSSLSLASTTSPCLLRIQSSSQFIRLDYRGAAKKRKQNNEKLIEPNEKRKIEK